MPLSAVCFMGHMRSSFHLETCHWCCYPNMLQIYFYNKHNLCIASFKWMSLSFSILKLFILWNCVQSRLWFLSHSVSKQLWCRRLWRSSAVGEKGSSHGNRFLSHWPCDHNSLLCCTLHHGTHLHKYIINMVCLKNSSHKKENSVIIHSRLSLAKPVWTFGENPSHCFQYNESEGLAKNTKTP